MFSVNETPVEFLPNVSRLVGRDIFIKRDDLTNRVYGGNKVRKLVRILADVQRTNTTDIVTVGAVGSHHVLATAVHSADLGVKVHAVLAPQPYTPHVETNAKAYLSQGVIPYPVSSNFRVPLEIAKVVATLKFQGKRPYFINVGGSSAAGAAGYVDAVTELQQQQQAGKSPVFTAMACAIGSGGTYAGLLGGTRAFGVSGIVLGILVTFPTLVPPSYLASLARRSLRFALRERGIQQSVEIRSEHVCLVKDQLGQGYGHPTDRAKEAQELFEQDAVALDLTYTAKTAAGLIAAARANHEQKAKYLYWHTLSSAPKQHLVTIDELPTSVAQLMLRASE